MRKLVRQDEFIEIYCCADLTVCEQRDVKGLYAKARRGEISNFTGISSPYQPPLKPELVLNTGQESLKECIDKVLVYLVLNGMITS